MVVVVLTSASGAPRLRKENYLLGCVEIAVNVKLATISSGSSPLETARN